MTIRHDWRRRTHLGDDLRCEMCGATTTRPISVLRERRGFCPGEAGPYERALVAKNKHDVQDYLNWRAGMTASAQFDLCYGPMTVEA